jgi:Uma2 family endonuclease
MPREAKDHGMTTATATPKVWTVTDLLAMPDDGVERWVIRGHLRMKPGHADARGFVRSRTEALILANVGSALVTWSRQQPDPRGAVYAGRAGVIFARNPDTVIGVDVAFAPAAVVAVQDDDTTTLLDGVPTLVVEILSPNDTVEQFHGKVREYLRAGVPVVWVIDPEDRTVKVYRPGFEPDSFNVTHRMPEHPALPGFAPGVAELFE